MPICYYFVYMYRLQAVRNGAVRQTEERCDVHREGEHGPGRAHAWMGRGHARRALGGSQQFDLVHKLIEITRIFLNSSSLF